MDAARPGVRVGIVGAGPVGLTLAARLASLGIASLVMEANPALRNQGSRACLIQGDVLEILDKFGCADQIRDEGVRWRIGHTYVRDKEVRKTVYPEGIGFGPFVNISQSRIEQVLLNRVQDDPLCEVAWSHRVTGVAQGEDGVRVEVETEDGQVVLDFPYLVACDGVHSQLRELLQVSWTGYSHRDRFLIVDIRAKLPFAKERHFHYDPSANPGRQLVIHPQPDDVWRIDWQLPPDADIEAEDLSGGFDRRVRAVTGDVPYAVEWRSTYRFHQRVVDRFVVGRVFLAGDAAHALPPYGARGMNSGIQDADNLAWKLALALRGQAAESLFETYHTERYEAARENLAVTEATIRFMVPPSFPRRLARTVLLRLAVPVKAARRYINSGNMAEPHVYTGSPIIDSASGHPLIGHFAPDGWVLVDGRMTRLRSLLGQHFVALRFDEITPTARRLIDDVLGRCPTLPLQFLLVLPPGATPTALHAQVTAVHETGNVLSAAYAGGHHQWIVVRPDCYIATVFTDEIDASRVEAMLRRCMGLRADGEVTLGQRRATLGSASSPVAIEEDR